MVGQPEAATEPRPAVQSPQAAVRRSAGAGDAVAGPVGPIGASDASAGRSTRAHDGACQRCSSAPTAPPFSSDAGEAEAGEAVAPATVPDLSHGSSLGCADARRRGRLCPAIQHVRSPPKPPLHRCKPNSSLPAHLALAILSILLSTMLTIVARVCFQCYLCETLDDRLCMLNVLTDMRKRGLSLA